MRSKAYETYIDPGLHDIVQTPSFIMTLLVSQVIIANAKVPDATRINDLDEDVLEGRYQDIPSHRTFKSRERDPDVNKYDLSERW